MQSFYFDLSLSNLSENWSQSSLLSSLLIVPSSSVNMERLENRNVEMGTFVNICVRKWRLLLELGGRGGLEKSKQSQTEGGELSGQNVCVLKYFNDV